MDPNRAFKFLVGSGLLAVTALAACGCAKSESPEGATPVASLSSGNAGPSSSAPTAGPTVSEEDALRIGTAFEKAIHDGDTAKANSFIDWDALLEAAVSGIDAPKATSDAFRKGVKQGSNEPTSIVQQIVREVSEGARFTFLQSRSRHKRRTVLFRLIGSNGGVNYADYVLALSPYGQARIVDIYSFTTGELTSKTIRRFYIPLAAQASRGIIERLTGSDQLLVKHQDQFAQFGEQVNGGKAAEAMATYRQFPPGLQKDKSILMMRMKVAQDLGDDEYASFFEDFRKFHPNDPGMNMLSIDYYATRKQYELALKSADRLEKAVGGDAYLKVMRASIQIETHENEKARKDLEAAIVQEPTLVDAYWTLVALSLAEKNFDETLKSLKTIREKFAVEFDDMSGVPLYAEFTKSPQYAEWELYLKGDDSEPDLK